MKSKSLVFILMTIFLVSSLNATKYSELSISDLNQLALKNDINAQYWLGYYYYGYLHNGTSVKDSKKALKWLTEAYEQ